MKRQTPPTLESKLSSCRAVSEMQKSLDSRVYFDQNGVLCQRLGIDQVPARVSADSRRSLPERWNLFRQEEGRKRSEKPGC